MHCFFLRRQRLDDSARAALLRAQKQAELMASYLISPDQAAYNLKMKMKAESAEPPLDDSDSSIGDMSHSNF